VATAPLAKWLVCISHPTPLSVDGSEATGSKAETRIVRALATAPPPDWPPAGYDSVTVVPVRFSSNGEVVTPARVAASRRKHQPLSMLCACVRVEASQLVASILRLVGVFWRPNYQRAGEVRLRSS
jgi:hypothetical protein